MSNTVYNGISYFKIYNDTVQMISKQSHSHYFKMDTIQNNDSIILKGTSFKSKPIFASFKYPRFDELVEDLMIAYGKTISTGQPTIGRELIFLKQDDNSVPKSKAVPIPLQRYFLPFYCSMLLVVGSDQVDTLTITSPIDQNVRKYFEYSKRSDKTKIHETMLYTIERETQFVPLTYNCTTMNLERNWYTTVHLRQQDAVQLYVVPKPLEYFPMLFVNCSEDNIKCMYDNITALMISRNEPLFYRPYMFTCSIFRPIIFNIIEDRIEYKQRLPGIDVTDEEFVIRRTEQLGNRKRYMVSDCNCRSNKAVIPLDKSQEPIDWYTTEIFFNNFHCNARHKYYPPYYVQRHQDCHGHCD